MAHCPKVTDVRIYDKMHNYFAAHNKANHCSINSTHTSKRYEWACIAKEYTENLEDYIQLCVPCHRKLDMTEKSRRTNQTNRIGVPSPTRRKVIAEDPVKQISYNFACINHGAKYFGILRSAIAHNLAGRSESSGGLIWRYAGIKS